MMTADTVVAPEGPVILAVQEQCKPLLPLEAGGNEATRSPAASVSAVPMEKGVLSSPDDDSSINESPCGDGRTVSGELLVNNSLPVWW